MLKRKSIPALAMILVMCAGLCTFVSASEKNPYRDVSEDKWYCADVLKANELGIMKGVSDDLFSPEQPMTREMFVTALYRMAQIGNAGEGAFLIKYDDVNYKLRNKWYYYPVVWATDMGVTQGIDENTFGVGIPVTREQIAAFIFRYLNNRFIAVNVPQTAEPAALFSDAPSDYAKDAVEYMRLTGIVNGVGDNKFAPKATATRAEVAAMLCRLYDAAKDAVYRFDFETDRYKEIRISINTDGQSRTKSITDKAEIARMLEYVNTIEITSSYEADVVNPYECSVELFDNSRNDFIFAFGITDTGGALHNNRVFETDKFKPFLSLTDN